MSDTPETDALTSGCTFGPFVEALAEKCRELEIQRDMLRKALADILGGADSWRLANLERAIAAARQLLIKQSDEHTTAAKGEVQP